MAYTSNTMTFQTWCYTALNELKKTKGEKEGIIGNYIMEKLRI